MLENFRKPYCELFFLIIVRCAGYAFLCWFADLRGNLPKLYFILKMDETEWFLWKFFFICQFLYFSKLEPNFVMSCIIAQQQTSIVIGLFMSYHIIWDVVKLQRTNDKMAPNSKVKKRLKLVGGNKFLIICFAHTRRTCFFQIEKNRQDRIKNWCTVFTYHCPCTSLMKQQMSRICWTYYVKSYRMSWPSSLKLITAKKYLNRNFGVNQEWHYTSQS